MTHPAPTKEEMLECLEFMKDVCNDEGLLSEDNIPDLALYIAIRDHLTRAVIVPDGCVVVPRQATKYQITEGSIAVSEWFTKRAGGEVFECQVAYAYEAMINAALTRVGGGE